MKDNKLTLLLHIIKSNGNINKLVREGVSFKEITNLTNNAIEKGYLTYENERIFVTEKGNDFLNQTTEAIKKTNKNEWIERALLFQCLPAIQPRQGLHHRNHFKAGE